MMSKKQTAEFLLRFPPLAEIKGPIVCVVENFRAVFIEESFAVQLLINEHERTLNEYIETAKVLSQY